MKDMEYLSEDVFAKLRNYKGYVICTAREPGEYDFFGYIIDDFAFYGEKFNTIQDAMYAIDKKEKNT